MGILFSAEFFQLSIRTIRAVFDWFRTLDEGRLRHLVAFPIC
jgi:hypothetical protein